jgi:anion-transporting  ArsA/GET3 family ATPase
MIVDAPATGHGLTLLSAARTMTDMARIGPFHELAHIIERLLADAEKTAVFLVTLPEELPVNETLQLIASLGEDRRLLAGVVVNQVRAAPLPPAPPWEQVRQILETSDSPDLRALANMAVHEVRRGQAQQAAIERLRQQLAPHALPPLPLLPQIEPHELGSADLRTLAAALEGAWAAE